MTLEGAADEVLGAKAFERVKGDLLAFRTEECCR